MTIRRRLTIWYTSVLVLIIIVFSVLIIAVTRETMIRQIDTDLQEIEEIIHLQTRLIQNTNNSPNSDIVLPSIDQVHVQSLYIQAWSKVQSEDNRFILVDSSTNISGFQTPLSPRSLGLHFTEITNSTFEGVPVRVLTRPLLGQSGAIIGYLQIANDLSIVNSTIENILYVMLIASGLAIIGAGIISLWFAHRTLQPIKKLTDTASQIANTTQVDTRLTWSGPQDEIGDLVSVFNQMMSRIQHLLNVQQRFVSDVSHELRTPLTSIIGNVELMQRYGSDQVSLDAIHYESQRMNRLVNDLLLLARADYGQVSFELMPIDLDTVLLESFEAGQQAIGDRDLTIDLTQLQPTQILGNSHWLTQLLANLISNAIKFTPDGGKISLGLENIDDRVILWVQDTGCGIHEEEHEAIFNRFHRGDPARKDDGGNFGLGLAIAKWIVQTHHGTIYVHNSVINAGTTFVVSFPALTDENPDPQKIEQSATTIKKLKRLTSITTSQPEPDPPQLIRRP